MTLVKDLKSPGELLISPLVLPSDMPASSSGEGKGSPYGPSTLVQAGSTVQRSDSLTGYWDGNAPGLVLAFDGPGPGMKWKVERASVGAVAQNWQNCEVHAGEYKASNPFATLVDNSIVPTTDIADEASPIYVGPGQPLIFIFKGTAAAPGDDGTARIQYTEEVV